MKQKNFKQFFIVHLIEMLVKAVQSAIVIEIL